MEGCYSISYFQVSAIGIEVGAERDDGASEVVAGVEWFGELFVVLWVGAGSVDADEDVGWWEGGCRWERESSEGAG